MTNENNTVLYTGVTNDLERRIAEHREGSKRSFCGRYQISKLVYCEEVSDVRSAIAREKQIKAGSRKKKVQLVESVNREWKDLSME